MISCTAEDTWSFGPLFKAKQNILSKNGRAAKFLWQVSGLSVSSNECLKGGPAVWVKGT